MKGESMQRLLQAIRQVVSGSFFFSAALLAGIVTDLLIEAMRTIVKKDSAQHGWAELLAASVAECLDVETVAEGLSQFEEPPLVDAAPLKVASLGAVAETMRDAMKRSAGVVKDPAASLAPCW